MLFLAPVEETPRDLNSSLFARQSQGRQCPNDGQACRYAMLASVGLREKNVWLVGTEETNSVFNWSASRGLKKTQKTECISTKTNTHLRSKDFECILDGFERLAISSFILVGWYPLCLAIRATLKDTSVSVAQRRRSEFGSDFVIVCTT